MTDDLTALLRDAGREPTIDVDVDDLHARGRRRTVVRAAALGVGALALLGVLGVGLTNLLDAPDAPIVGPEPGRTTTPSASPADEEVTVAALAAELGMDVLRQRWDPRAFTGVEIERTSPSGDAAVDVWDVEPASDAVVATDGTLWMLDLEGRTVRRDAVTGVTSVVTTAAPGTGWVPLVATEAGEALVTAVPVDPDTERPRPSTLRLLGADGTFGDLAGIDVGARVGPDEFIGLAAWRPEHVAVTIAGDTGSRVDLLPAGAAPVTALELAADTRVTSMAFVGDELWVVQLDAAAGAARLHRLGLDGELRGTTPLDLGGPVAWPLSVGPRGEHVVLPVGPRAEVPVAHVLDVDAIRGGATPGEAARAVAVSGLVHLVEPARSDQGTPAACTERLLNPPPGQEVAVWFLCWDAADRLPEGAAHPFVHGDDRFAGAELAPGADGIRTVLEAWADGPTAAEAGAGLTGGLQPQVASIAGVTLDGTTVTVDLAAGPQVGVLGTTTGRATAVQAIVGAVLQLDGPDEVVLTLGGSCADWARLAETEGCPTYDEANTPWQQGLR